MNIESGREFVFHFHVHFILEVKKDCKGTNTLLSATKKEEAVEDRVPHYPVATWYIEKVSSLL